MNMRVQKKLLARPKSKKPAYNSAQKFAEEKMAKARRGFFSQFALVRRRLPKINVVSADNLPKRNVLVLAPHPEEPVEKCFATIQGFKNAGGNVAVHVLTPGWRGVELTRAQQDLISNSKNPEKMDHFIRTKIRLKELKQADNVLGVNSEVHSMDYYKNSRISREDLVEMKGIIDSGKWDVVIMPDVLDIQPTHAVSYDIAMKFLKSKVRRTQKPIELWGFETSYHQHPLTELNQVVKYSAEIQDKKMKALKKHVSQNQRKDVEFVARMAETERSSAIAEEVGGFGSHVEFGKAERIEAFSRTTLKPFGPFVFRTKERQ
jgi:LmbE family N-acetylglucosaminyl deacetylase